MCRIPCAPIAAVLLVLLTACTAPPPASSASTALPSATFATPSATTSPSTVPTATPIMLPSFAQLSALSATVVWALVAGTRLFRSSDRGDTWAERSVPPGLANIEVSFADDTNGLLLSPGSPAGPCRTQTASIWKTADGAASWQQVTATGIAEPMCKRGLASADATHAFFTAYGPNSGPVIYRTAPPIQGGPRRRNGGARVPHRLLAGGGGSGGRRVCGSARRLCHRARGDPADRRRRRALGRDQDARYVIRRVRPPRTAPVR